MKKTSVISGLALGSLMALGSAHATTPFDATLLATAHQNVSKAADAKCGDGKCGDTAKESTKAANANEVSSKKTTKKVEAKCGASSDQAGKKADAKCGEGKCG